MQQITAQTENWTGNLQEQITQELNTAVQHSIKNTYDLQLTTHIRKRKNACNVIVDAKTHDKERKKV